MKTKTKTYQENLTELRANLTAMLPEEFLALFDNDANHLQQTHYQILQLEIGDKAPDFTLSNAQNENVRLQKLLQDSRVVLVFYRGSWCPYCNLQLAHYQQALEEMHWYGAQLVAISPQTPDESLSIKEKNELQFEVLSDNGNLIARKYTTVFKNGERPIEAMTALGIDFHAHYSDDSGELPVPAVFVIEQDGTVSFAASTGGDYRKRVDASVIIAHLKATS
ncbi:peroxiredoxin-like family protein [Croceiramulus getboli]|nr:peroxiredoxin-like family protein [Flavobacteriaceae bacterium YJPT1-3]